MFNEQKTAQMAAFFLGKTEEKQMPHLKLMKLLYLADRESVRLSGWLMTGDYMVSMPHGPVLSQTLNLMDGDVESVPGGWEYWVSDKENHELSLRRSFAQDDLDEISRAEMNVLSSVWVKFGSMGRWEIRDWTHEHCGEWTDPRGSSRPIRFYDLAIAVGFDTETADVISQRMCEERRMDHVFSSL